MCLLISGCEARYPYVSNDETQTNSYNKVAVEVVRVPQNMPDSNIAKVAPDRYYRQPTNPEMMPQNIPPQQNQWQQPYPYYAPQVTYPYRPQPYYQQHNLRRYNAAQQQEAGSRFYSNPYAIPPTTQKVPRYDGDQFYSPPNLQNNQEPILDPSEFNQ